MLSPRQAVEVFHLCFLRLLTADADRRLFTLKGGCNLRFFFGSVRFSEDMDLDVGVVAKTTLKNKVDRLLAGKPLVALLSAAGGIAISEVSSPKQTETTQRWKMALRVEGLAVPLRTKIELSRRPAAGEVAFEAIDRNLARAYHLTAPLVSHYTAPSALLQKLGALAGRQETQARDIYDLHLLMPHAGNAPRVDRRTRDVLPAALERALDVSYDDYRAQVVAFLEPDQQELLGSRASWDDMQSAVVDFIEELAKS